MVILPEKKLQSKEVVGLAHILPRKAVTSSGSPCLRPDAPHWAILRKVYKAVSVPPSSAFFYFQA